MYKEIVLELGSNDGNTLEVVEQVIKDLHDLDRSGQVFRYADAKRGTFKLPEDAIDLRNTREVMKQGGAVHAGYLSIFNFLPYRSGQPSGALL